MKSHLAELVERLKDVHWATDPTSSELLSKYNIEHGFLGRPPVDALRQMDPHHVKQVHGTKITQASNLTMYDAGERPDADGIYSVEADVVAVKTADCLPVLIASTNGAFVAAVHAGWRGFTSGILINALKIAHSNQGVNSLRVVVGPAISRQKFEVGTEVVEAMQGVECGLSDDAWGLTVSKGQNDRWHVDLPAAAALQMMIAGIKPNHIEVIQSCTVTSQKENQCLWASYRREGKACGSNWTWIRGR